MAQGSPVETESPMSREGRAPVDRAVSLQPLIEAAAEDIESLGSIPPALLAALHEARLFRLLLPRSLGGLEVAPVVFIEVLEALARADASTAWVVAQGCGCSLSAAYLAPAVAAEVFADSDSVLAWGPSGTGATARVTDAGYRVTGRWHFASGNRHARWLGGHCTLVGEDGNPLLDGTGRPIERTVIFPRTSATVLTDWNVIGLRGTGSDSYAVDDLLVPAALSYRREASEEKREHGPLYSFTGMSIFALGIAAMGLGLARALLDSFIAIARDKKDRVSGRPLRESGAVQAELAKAEGRLAAARALLLTTARELYDHAAAGAEFSHDQRIRLRLSTTWAAAEARAAADFAYTTAGATAIFAREPFERRFRDMHTLTQQVQAHGTNFELVGQAILGASSNSRLL